MAIAYSIGQITKSVYVRQSVSVCPPVGTLTVAFLDRFHQNCHRYARTPKGKNEFVMCQHRMPKMPKHA